MTTFLLLLKYFFWSVLCTLLQVVFLSVTKLLLEYNFRVLFTPLMNSDSSLRLMSCMFVHNFEAIGHATSVLEPENRPASLA